MKEKIVVGLSGGVDSSVAAYLLKEKGYDVIGVTMQMLADNPLGTEDARKVAELLDIPFYVMNFDCEFRKNVIDRFIDEYLAGRTPNPCIECNRHVKWQALIDRAHELGASYIATGHYARIDKLSNGRYAIRRSVTQAKDQTYALYKLTQEQLAHTIMPVGEYEKSEIREIAEKIGLNVADKPDSQEICFIPDKDYAGFIRRETGIENTEGNFVLEDGTVLGKHKGIFCYTIGQRKGLGLSMGRPVNVKEIRPLTNDVVIGEPDSVFTDELTAIGINCMSVPEFKAGDRMLAKIRYSHQGEMCTVKSLENDTISLQFDNPVRAVTPGQAVVFYDDEYVMGGAMIIK